MGVREPMHIGKNIIGRFSSLKMNRMIWFESTIERDFIYLLEYDAEVLRFEEQPTTIEYRVGKKTRKYTPDFKVDTKTGTLLVECKPESKADHPDYQARFTAAADWCADRKWGFEVVTEQDIRTGHRLSNVRTLFYHARRSVSLETVKQAEHLLAGRSLALRELATSIDASRAAEIQSDLLCLAFHRHLTLDVTGRAIDGQSLVSLEVQ